MMAWRGYRYLGLIQAEEWAKSGRGWREPWTSTASGAWPASRGDQLHASHGLYGTAAAREYRQWSALLAEVQHVEDLVVAAFTDGDEVGETAVLGEAQRPVEVQGIGVVATGVQGEDLDTRRPGVSDQGSGQRSTYATTMGSSIYRDLLQIGMWPMGRSGIAEPVPQPDKPTSEVSGTQGRLPGPHRRDDVAEKFPTSSREGGSTQPSAAPPLTRSARIRWADSANPASSSGSEVSSMASRMAGSVVTPPVMAGFMTSSLASRPRLTRDPRSAIRAPASAAAPRHQLLHPRPSSPTTPTTIDRTWTFVRRNDTVARLPRTGKGHSPSFV